MGSVVKSIVTRPARAKATTSGGRHEEIRLDVLVDARFKIAVAGKHGGGDDVVFRHRLLDGRGQRAGVADAGGAAVADEVEAELVQIRLQAGLCPNNQ